MNEISPKFMTYERTSSTLLQREDFAQRHRRHGRLIIADGTATSVVASRGLDSSLLMSLISLPKLIFSQLNELFICAILKREKSGFLLHRVLFGLIGSCRRRWNCQEGTRTSRTSRVVSRRRLSCRLDRRHMLLFKIMLSRDRKENLAVVG